MTDGLSCSGPMMRTHSRTHTRTSEQHQAKDKAFSTWAFGVHPDLVNITVINCNEEPY